MTEVQTYQALEKRVDGGVSENPVSSSIEPNLHYLDHIKGLTNRIAAVLIEHFGNDLPVIHFTNAEVGNEIGKLVSTGFLESFTSEGFIKQTHVGAFKKQDIPGGPFRDISFHQDGVLVALHKLRKIVDQFYHHGLRTNKNQLTKSRGASYSLPAAIIMEKPGKLGRGTDNYDHWIVRDSQGAEKILAIVKFDLHQAVNWITLKRTQENEILKRIIHGLGSNRLAQIATAYHKAHDPHTKANLALYAHDLVDAYLVDPNEFDSIFAALDVSVRKIIDERRQKYNLFGVNILHADQS